MDDETTNAEPLTSVTVTEVQNRLANSRGRHCSYEKLNHDVANRYWTSAGSEVRNILTCTRAGPMREGLMQLHTLLSAERIDLAAVAQFSNALAETNAREMVYWGKLEKFVLSCDVPVPENLQTW